MASMIDKLLLNGAVEIDLDTIRSEGEPSKIKEHYESLGYEIILESDCMIFNKKDKRQLLNG